MVADRWMIDGECCKLGWFYEQMSVCLFGCMNATHGEIHESRSKRNAIQWTRTFHQTVNAPCKTV